MAVAAGRAADPRATARRVVVVSRDFPLIEGGNGAVLLAGLSLPADLPVAEVLGGPPAALDQILSAREGTLVVTADDNAGAVGAGAVLVGADGAELSPVARQTRSLPVVARGQDGARRSYGDPRLQREVGIKATVARLNLTGTPTMAVVAGSKAAQLGVDVDAGAAVEDPSGSASGLIAALASAIEKGTEGVVLALEQSSATAARLVLGLEQPAVTRDEAEARELPNTTIVEGVGIPISLAAYARAFEPKLRWEAKVYDESLDMEAGPVFPPRTRVETAGKLATDYCFEPLPRTGTVHTLTTIRILVPDLPSPYSLAIVQLDDSPVRVLLKITGVPAGELAIGDAGSVVLRKIADRAGIPDYGYEFWPGRTVPGTTTTSRGAQA